MNKNTMERRTFAFNVRAAGDATAPKKLAGYAAVFGVETELWDGLFEMIEPGAFAKTIASDDVRALWNHNVDFPIGRTKSGTLRLWEDAEGLGCEITPPDTDLVRDMVVSPIIRGDVDQMSFGFQIVREKWEERSDGTVLITLVEIKLFEISPVTLPAYADTTISARSLARIEEFKQRQAPAEDAEDAELALRLAMAIRKFPRAALATRA